MKKFIWENANYYILNRGRKEKEILNIVISIFPYSIVHLNDLSTYWQYIREMKIQNLFENSIQK